MKSSGYILSIFVMVLGSSQALQAADSCSRLFFTESTSPKLLLTLDPAFLPRYIEVANELQKKTYEPQGLSDSPANELLSESKMNFLKKNAVNVQKLISQGELTIEELVKSRVFLAENLKNGLARPQSYILITGQKVYSFDLKGEEYIALSDNRVGKVIAVEGFFRLGKTLSLFVQNNNVYLYARENKDPDYFLELAASNKLPASLAQLASTHKSELYDILSNTSVSIAILATAPMTKAVLENGTKVQILTVQLLESSKFVFRNIYFTDKAQTLESTNKKRWGILEFSPHIGFHPEGDMRLTAEDGTKLIVKDGVLTYSNEAKAVNLLLTMSAVLGDSHTSKFRGNFVKQYGDVIKDLINKNSFDEIIFQEVLKKLDVMIDINGNPFYLLPSKDGDLFFSVKENKFGKVSELTALGYGKTFYPASEEMIEVGRSVGYLSQMVSRRVRSDYVSLNEKAYFTKIEIALGIKLTKTQQNALGATQASIQDLSPEQIVARATKIKTTLITKGAFSKRESEEIIKILF